MPKYEGVWIFGIVSLRAHIRRGAWNLASLNEWIVRKRDA
jgi:hypothetical protein